MKDLKCAVCSVQSSLSCSKCKLVSYCSKNHQSEHWEQHKTTCLPIKLQFNADFNRQVYKAKHDIGEGTIIFVDTPVMIFPMMRMVNDSSSEVTGGGKICMGCCTQDVKEKCSKCGWPVCNKKCENEDFHAKLECKVFAGKYPHRELQEVYFRSAVIRALMMKLEYPEKWDSLMQFPHGYPAQRANPQDKKNKAVTVHFVHFSCDLKQFDVETIVKVWEIIEVNLKADSLIPTCAKLELKGQGIIMGCLPNIVSYPTPHYETAEGQDKYSRYYFAMRNIKKGEPLVAGINDKNDNISGTQERRQFIAKFVGYNCACIRCRDPTECGTYFSAIACPCKPEIKQGYTNIGYFLPLNPLEPNSDWKCNSCLALKNVLEIRQIVASCQKTHEENKETFYSKFMAIFMIALKDLSCAKREKRDLTKDEKERIELATEGLPTVMQEQYDRSVAMEVQLHPNHFILIKERIMLLNGLFFYLQLNRKEPCVLDSVGIRQYVFPIKDFQFFDGVPKKWILFNEELRNSSMDLLQILHKVFPIRFYECDLLYFYLMLSKWMILKESVKTHKNYSQFVGDFTDWKETRKNVESGFLKYHATEVSKRYLACLKKIDSCVPKDASDTFPFYTRILEGKV